MTPKRLQEIRDREKDHNTRWNILAAQRDRHELLEYIVELEARCKGKMCIDPEAISKKLNDGRGSRRNDPFLVEPLPQGALPIYDKGIDVVDAVVGDGEEP